MGGIGARIREAMGSIAEVFRNPGLRRLNLALAGAVVGDWAYAVAVAVYAYLEGGPTTVGVLGVIRFVLGAIIMPFASTLADRYDRRNIMLVTDLARVVLVLVAAGVIWADGPAMAVYALAIVTSLAGSPFRPAQAAMLPQLARHPGELTAANVATSTIESAGFFVGPAIAGLLLAVADIEHVYVLNALTFLWSAALIRGLKKVTDAEVAQAASEVDAAAAESAGDVSTAGASDDVADEPESEPTSIFKDAAAGFKTIFGNRDLRLLILIYTAQTVVAGASLVFTVAIALDLLEMSPSGAGLLDATVGVGGLVGGFLALVLAQRGKLAWDFGIGVMFWSLPLVLVAAFPELWAAVAGMVAIGLANSVVDVNAFTIIQRLTPNEVMGRVFGAMESTIIAGMAIGSLAMPLLMELINLRAALLIIGAVVAGLTLLGMPGLRRIDRVALAAEGLELLRSVPILAPLGASVLERLARASVVRTYATGDTVFAEGDAGDHFFVIEDGTVEVRIRGEHIRDLGPGDSFGEIALLRDVPRTATVVATSDLTCRTLDRQDFVPAVSRHSSARTEAEAVVNRWLAVV